jgi:hypothetical protein
LYIIFVLVAPPLAASKIVATISVLLLYFTNNVVKDQIFMEVFTFDHFI